MTNVVSRARRLVVTRLRESPVEPALLLAVALLLFAWEDAGVTPIWHWGVWWAFFWIPVWGYTASCVLCALGDRGPRKQLAIAVGLFLPVLFLLEIPIGRTTRVPWCLTHGMAAVAFAAAGWVLRTRLEARMMAAKVLFLVVLASALPALHFTVAGSFWADCLRLRVGMSVSEALTVMEDHWVQDARSDRGEDRFPIAELDRGDTERYVGFLRWKSRELVVFSTSDFNADICWTEFRDGRLVEFLPWPD